MQLDRFLKTLSDHAVEFRESEPMSRHTSFGIGGAADCFVIPRSAEELRFVFAAAADCEVPTFLIGNGSDLLVSDRGIEGAVISTGGFTALFGNDCTLIADAGVKLATLCLAARDAGLSGLEFAYGIPGTVGGALYMNAGAYGGEMKDVVSSAKVLTQDGSFAVRRAEEMALGYRTSAFQQNGETVLSVAFCLTPDDPAAIGAKMEDFMARRKEKQPLEYKSAGSTFKRPAGYYAGTLIDECGLKGSTVGDAEVSTKHAGFIVNKGNATADDVKALMEQVQGTVWNRKGVLLEPEVIFIGRP